jgi:hypothetical protein
MTAFFIALVLVPACAFYLYALTQFRRELAQLRSGRARPATLVKLTSSDLSPIVQVESPELGPVPVIPIRSARFVAEAMERRRAG